VESQRAALVPGRGLTGSSCLAEVPERMHRRGEPRAYCPRHDIRSSGDSRSPAPRRLLKPAGRDSCPSVSADAPPVDRIGGGRRPRRVLALPIGATAFPQEIPTATRALRRTRVRRGRRCPSRIRDSGGHRHAFPRAASRPRLFLLPLSQALETSRPVGRPPLSAGRTSPQTSGSAVGCRVR
jgi:hypothetical protein